MLEFKRKMEGRTNYNKRHKLLLSGETRFIVRITNTQIIVHAVKYEPAGDRTVAYATSKELETQGWPHAHKNIPSAYLTGLLCARRAAKENIISGIIDLGLRTVHKKGRVFSAIKGLVDGGVKIALDETTLPETTRIHGVHLKEDSTKAPRFSPQKGRSSSTPSIVTPFPRIFPSCHEQWPRSFQPSVLF